MPCIRLPFHLREAIYDLSMSFSTIYCSSLCTIPCEYLCMYHVKRQMTIPNRVTDRPGGSEFEDGPSVPRGEGSHRPPGEDAVLVLDRRQHRHIYNLHDTADDCYLTEKIFAELNQTLGENVSGYPLDYGP